MKRNEILLFLILILTIVNLYFLLQKNKKEEFKWSQKDSSDCTWGGWFCH